MKKSDFEILEKPAPYRIPYRTGFVAGCFDVIHPGYIAMFREAKTVCEYLIVAVHNDPSLERSEKIHPVLPWQLRVGTLRAIRYVDEVYVYETEDQLYECLKRTKPDVRFLGDDYKDGQKPITGADLNIPIYWITRSEWSSTLFKKMIYESMKEHDL